MLATDRSSPTASEGLPTDDFVTIVHVPANKFEPAGQLVQWSEAVHSVQLTLHVSHCPVLVEPYRPVGQNVVQLPLKRKGAPELAGHDVHADASRGALHEPHAWSHGLQKPVALGAKPAGHVPRHWPRCMSVVLLLAEHVRQLESPEPSHVPHEVWQLAHVPLDVAYKPALHASPP